MRHFDPNRPVIRTVLNARHPYWPAILELRHLGFSLVAIADAFSWQGPMSGLARLCDLFMIDINDRPSQLSECPLWVERRAKLVSLSTKNYQLSSDEERLRQVLSGLLGEYLATIERRQHIADSVSPAVLPAMLTGEQLLLDCCLNILSMHDELPPTEDSHFFALRSHVRHVCERHLGRPPLPQPARVLELAVGY